MTQKEEIVNITPKEKFGIVFFLSGISFILIVLEQFVSLFREELFGFDSRSAGSNFGYNFMIFLPVIIISSILSFSALILYVRTYKIVESSGEELSWFERLSILPAILPFLGILFIIVIILLSITSSY